MRPINLNNYSVLLMFFWENSFAGWLVEADVLEKRAASIFSAEVGVENRDSTLLQNVGFH
jgi:hypothetical protein